MVCTTESCVSSTGVSLVTVTVCVTAPGVRLKFTVAVNPVVISMPSRLDVAEAHLRGGHAVDAGRQVYDPVQAVIAGHRIARSLDQRRTGDFDLRSGHFGA